MIGRRPNTTNTNQVPSDTEETRLLIHLANLKFETKRINSSTAIIGAVLIVVTLVSAGLLWRSADNADLVVQIVVAIITGTIGFLGGTQFGLNKQH